MFFFRSGFASRSTARGATALRQPARPRAGFAGGLRAAPLTCSDAEPSSAAPSRGQDSEAVQSHSISDPGDRGGRLRLAEAADRLSSPTPEPRAATQRARAARYADRGQQVAAQWTDHCSRAAPTRTTRHKAADGVPRERTSSRAKEPLDDRRGAAPRGLVASGCIRGARAARLASLGHETCRAMDRPSLSGCTRGPLGTRLHPKGTTITSSTAKEPVDRGPRSIAAEAR